MEPVGLEQTGYDALVNADPANIMARKELLSLIDEHLAADLRRDYCCFLDGGQLSAWRENKLLEAIRCIINNFYSEGDWDAD